MLDHQTNMSSIGYDQKWRHSKLSNKKDELNPVYYKGNFRKL